MKQIPALVTVGIASYNNEAYLLETLDSIRQQTYPNIEILIVDDASQDNSASIAQHWLSAHPEVNGRLIRHITNKGLCSVCNDIISECKGKFVTIIGSDDICLPTNIEQHVKAFSQLDDSYAVCYGDVVRIDATGAILDGGKPMHYQRAKPEGYVFKNLLVDNFIPAIGVLVRASVYKEVGGYDESLAYEDWDMWLRISKKYQIKYTAKTVAYYRVHNKSMISTRLVQIAESSIKLLSKHLGYREDTDELVRQQLDNCAVQLYVLGNSNARYWLSRSWRRDASLKTKLYTLLAGAGIKYGLLAQLRQLFKLGTEKTA